MTIALPPRPLADADTLCRLSAGELAAAYKAHKLSPVEVTKAALARAEAVNTKCNAFTLIDHETALTAARESETRWQRNEPMSLIDGIPTTLKDIVWAAGWSVRYGSLTTDTLPYKEDAPAVDLLRRAGAVFIGQTTTPEFGWKAVTDSSLCGITRNPWNPEMTPGGSSGGAAVAAATGAGVLHLGSDGGGSIRVPSSFTGIVGVKPTFGRVPAFPPSAFGTVSHIGPMTRTVDDAEIMLAAMSGRDLRDWAQGAGILEPLDRRRGVLAGARIGYWSKPACGSVDKEVAERVGAAVRLLEAFGARVEAIDLPGTDLLDIFYKHWFAGAVVRLSAVPPERHKDIDPGFLAVAAAGASYDAKSLMSAQVRRAEFGAAMDRLLADYDFVVSPGTAIPAFTAGLEVPAGSGLTRWIEWAGFNFPINLSQQPACIVPCGLTSSGLPIGLQIIGARGADARVLAAAGDFQEAHPDLLAQ
jgi:aspartyl-tRNA(Asn)/glutamyl-tRNA(Gln) amidotransferase subunit A